MSALNGNVLNSTEGDGNGEIGEGDKEINEEDHLNKKEQDKVEIEVDNGIGTNLNKVKKVNLHDAAIVHILQKGKDKIRAKNLPAVWYRNNCRMAREQLALRNSIYENMMNIKDCNFINVTIYELNKQEDGNIFGIWDKEINNLT